MTATGYPVTKPVSLRNEPNLEQVIAEHFDAPTPNYKDAIEAIRTAIDSLEDGAKDIDAAAKAVEKTTNGYMLQNTADGIRDEIDFLKRLQERLRRMA